MKKSKGFIFGIIGIVMVLAGFILFTVSGFTSVSNMREPNIAIIVISIVLFMGGAIVSSIGFSIAMKSRIKSAFNHDSDDVNSDSLFGQVIQTMKNKLEVENLEAQKDIQELEKQTINRKCSNCGASKEDGDSKCPYCGI